MANFPLLIAALSIHAVAIHATLTSIIINTCVQPTADDCKKCDLTRNPNRYMGDPCSCGYLQCVADQFGGFIVHKMDCAKCTCWDQDKLTCVTDPNADKSECTQRQIVESVSNNGKTCKRTGNGYKVKFESVAGDDQSYYMYLPSSDKIKMPCPSGTTFNIDECGCALGGKIKTPDPFMCLTFDDNDNPFDTKTGVYVNPHDVEIVDDGIVGKAARFNGASNIEVPAFNNKEASMMSLSLWYKETSTDDDTQALISNGDCETGADPSIQVLLQNRDNVKGGFRTTYGVDQIKTCPTSKDKGVNNWNHVAVVYNGAKVFFYLNGEKVHKSRAGGFVKAVQCPLLIGSMYGKNYFKGLMDQVCFYDYALSAAQVKKMYNKPAKVMRS